MDEPRKVSEKAIALREKNSDPDLALIKRTVAIGATDDELQMFLYDCKRRGVHPLDKLLHFTKRGGKYTPIVSIDLMRSRAAESGEMAGSDDAVFLPGHGKPESATVTVYRLTNGTRYGYQGTARWSEYYVNSPTWNKMPHVMLGKCAEAIALRKAFPQQLAGLYTREEMDQTDDNREDNLKTVTSGKVDYPAPDNREISRQALDAAVAQRATHPRPQSVSPSAREAPLNKLAGVPTPYDGSPSALPVRTEDAPAPEPAQAADAGEDFTQSIWDKPINTRVGEDGKAYQVDENDADIDHVPDPEAHIEATGNLKADEGWDALKIWWEGMLTKEQQDQWRTVLNKRWKPRAEQVRHEKANNPQTARKNN